MSEISRRQFVVYAVAVVLVVLLGGRALRTDTTSAGGAGTASATFAPDGVSASGSTGAAGASASRAGVEVSAETEPVLVHVAGAVRRPGVYTLRTGARIQDAVRRAGGGGARADLDALNLAAKLTDGQQVLVARRPSRDPRAASTSSAAPQSAEAASTAATGTTAGTAAAPVNINSADVTQLQELDGVGPAIAAKIVAWRTQSGPFRTVDDLAQVAGIGPKKLEAMRSQAVV